MYFPYFRGKQYELITIRENASLLATNNIVPIIEPVKKNLSSLKKAIRELVTTNTEFVLIINPMCGDLTNDSSPLIEEIVNDILSEYENFTLGYIINAKSNLVDMQGFIETHTNKRISLIHDGFPTAKLIAESIENYENIERHIFVGNECGIRYRRHFKGSNRVLIRDGFIKRNNREHPSNEHFSELHLTFNEQGMEGFGDFLIAGNDYMESGGPAYAIAIHITYLDDEEDMLIKHYVSDRTSSPVDPGGKFLEALGKLVVDIADVDSSIYKSRAINEFQELNDKSHFPGLGYVKKISMQHHLELMANFISD